MVEKGGSKLNNEEKEAVTKTLLPPKRIDNNIQTGEKNKKSNEDVANETEKVDDVDGDPSEEPPSRTKIVFDKLCGKVGINPNLFFLKVTLFAMYGGKLFFLPRKRALVII